MHLLSTQDCNKDAPSIRVRLFPLLNFWRCVMKRRPPRDAAGTGPTHLDAAGLSEAERLALPITPASDRGCPRYLPQLVSIV